MIKLIFLTLVVWNAPAALCAAPVDSLRMETIGGKQFIIHQIDEKETLYAISRRYGVQVTAILEHNPTADGGLAVGQLLKVPYTAKAKPALVSGGDRIHKVATKETLFSISRLYDVSVDEIKSWNNLKDNALSLGQELIIKKKSTALTNNTSLPATQSIKGAHTVAAKETLYSIARQYNVTVQQLREWNSLAADEVKIGQTLFVTQPMYQKPDEIKTQPEVVVVKPETKETPVVSVVKPEVKIQPEIKETTIRISESVTGSDEVKEGGLAELIEGTDGNRKYLALHRTAKVGTILKVRNELNNREVFVRVAGPLPSIGANTNVVLKISKSAYDRLGAIDSRFRVEVTYYK
ncbi:MAG TPA: LysM peptidoglycan-binding domain-containing protein [Cyclobacteriaceae bacterium]|jgi:LysM repeat protein|nr:LysM peptidoglycan-binding domain-containing protein [Cytophagales bacterium]HMR56938.1 LysM peptidoglycan-binding domain-containing protein [Cyclobacteriaceae bacterium]HNT50404.1 LysM peptidoglycan-binding domain-containing protein [Cyclobacteriaceae bacterium]HRE67872.1 LysM peptidoglycan-binding domain-containing protein [Cyclobacteriaceae bacterium]HRF33846.1 LysM peptidoglycan-binding domain-containing protein [Cyclobacteriaceae bacterium]